MSRPMSARVCASRQRMPGWAVVGCRSVAGAPAAACQQCRQENVPSRHSRKVLNASAVDGAHSGSELCTVRLDHRVTDHAESDSESSAGPVQARHWQLEVSTQRGRQGPLEREPLAEKADYLVVRRRQRQQ